MEGCCRRAEAARSLDCGRGVVLRGWSVMNLNRTRQNDLLKGTCHNLLVDTTR